MKPNKTNDSRQMFDRLVFNALDFLERSAKEIEEAPNYSVIHFCTAIELFLKARLLSEHWTLIYADLKKPSVSNEANLAKFREGDFISVGMKDAIARLRERLNLNITKDAEETFLSISRHRNKLIHFFHPSFVHDLDKVALERVVAEQCRGWYYLHPLLRNTWRSSFAPYLSHIEKVHSLMLEKRVFLRAKYGALSERMEKDKADGVVFRVCAAYGFEAMTAEFNPSPILSVDCLVCEIGFQCLQVRCGRCGADVLVAAPRAEPHCYHCSTLITLSDVLNQYVPGLASGSGAQEKSRALCGDISCVQDSEQESVLLFGDKWICLHCFAVEDDVWECESCGHLTAGECEGPLCLACENAEAEREWPSTSGGVM